MRESIETETRNQAKEIKKELQTLFDDIEHMKGSLHGLQERKATQLLRSLADVIRTAMKMDQEGTSKESVDKLKENAKSFRIVFNAMRQGDFTKPIPTSTFAIAPTKPETQTLNPEQPTVGRPRARSAREVDIQVTSLYQQVQTMISEANRLDDSDLMKRVGKINDSTKQLLIAPKPKEKLETLYQSLDALKKQVDELSAEIKEKQIKTQWKMPNLNTQTNTRTHAHLFHNSKFSREVDNLNRRKLTSSALVQEELKLKLATLHEIVMEHKKYWQQRSRFGGLPKPLSQMATEFEKMEKDKDGKPVFNEKDLAQTMKKFEKMAKGGILANPDVKELKDAIKNGNLKDLGNVLQKIQTQEVQSQRKLK